ncbi:MAG: phosphate acyltransferase PlsX [Lactobacillales bacterium]|jgi:glycerol-3-phosphate acyltransferase PlsX|nr:phosphate acyltransferase PlsX [Lactobacillales bacterium]
MKIAVDAMGGDNAPQAVVEGVNISAAEFPNTQFILYGDETQIKTHLVERANVTIVHTDKKVGSSEDPIDAVKNNRDSSMMMAIQAVKKGDADAVLSAGNSGALLAGGQVYVRPFLKGLRTGLMSTLPVFKGEFAGVGFDIVDLGANAENTARDLKNFAVLGSFYARHVRGIATPRVGLINNGTEDSKGSELTKEAFRLLSEAHEAGDINFVGNIEARDIFYGVADVVVTDGFTGNNILKTLEGTAKAIGSVLKDSIKGAGIRGIIGYLFLGKALKNMEKQMDYTTYGGAVLFGLKAPVVKTHGSANANAFQNTLRQIVKMLDSDVTGKLAKYFAEHED